MAATAIHRLTLDPMGKCSNAFFSETTNMIKAKLYMNVHWTVFYNLKVFCSDVKFKMAATAGPTARTARFSKKSPWSVFFRCEMSVICHKITVKCRWNHGETFTAKINKLGPKCRWNILIAGDNTAAKIIRVHTYM